MTESRLARDHGLRLDRPEDAMRVISSTARPCVFTLEDLSEEFFDLSNRIAGEVFQKLINYHCPVAIVVPPEHGLGDRLTELAREHARHPVIRFFPTLDEALAWPG